MGSDMSALSRRPWTNDYWADASQDANEPSLYIAIAGHFGPRRVRRPEILEVLGRLNQCGLTDPAIQHSEQSHEPFTYWIP